MSVTPAIKEYIEKKSSKLDKYFKDGDNTASNVIIKTRGNKDVIEVTIIKNATVIRAEVMDNDLYTAIDLVVEKLERQIRKNKTKLKKQTKSNEKIFNFDYELTIEEESNHKESKIVKRKVLEMKPMDEEEAILELELLSHDFFIYKDMNNNIKVLYKRKDGNYGIIETND